MLGAVAWAPLTLRPGHAAPPLRSPARLAAPSPLAIAVGTWKPVGAPAHPPPRRAGSSAALPRRPIHTATASLGCHAPRPCGTAPFALTGRSAPPLSPLPTPAGPHHTPAYLRPTHHRFLPRPQPPSLRSAALGASGRSLRSLSALAVVRTQPLIVPPTTLRYVGSTPFAALTLAVHTTQAGNAPWKHKHAAWARRKISTGIAGLCTALRGSAWAAPTGGVPPGVRPPPPGWGPVGYTLTPPSPLAPVATLSTRSA